MINHPLMVMVQEKHKELLKHPLCLGLLRRKWKKIGRYVFYSQLVIYVFYMICLTALVLYKLNSKTYPDDENHNKFLTECGLIHDPVEGGLQVKKYIVQCVQKPEMEFGFLMMGEPF